MDDMLWRLDAADLTRLTRAGDVSCRDVVQATLRRIDEVNPLVNAIVLSLDESALAAADQADRALHDRQPPGPLFGVCVTTKINTDQVGCPTDDGLANFASLMPKEDSPLVTRLRAAGAIIVGRNNSPAFGLAFDTDNLLHGRTHNPFDRSIATGGSSGGAATAVATGMGAIAQGNDLGGSLRWPAYCNGVVGLRPSPGRIPFYNSSFRGGMVFCEQLMTVHGPIARSVRDARTALEVMAGVDPRDPVTVPAPILPAGSAGAVKVALVTGLDGAYSSRMHPDVVAAVRQAGAHLAGAGYHVEEIEPPLLEDINTLFLTIAGKELAINLYPYLEKFTDPLMGATVRMFEQRCAGVSLENYIAAWRQRDHVIRQWQLFMQRYPLIVLPPCTQPSLPLFSEPGLDAAVWQLVSQTNVHQMLSPFLGFPSLAVPVSVTPQLYAGRPLGVQLLAPRYREDICLDAGEVIEAREGRRSPVDPVAD